MDIVILALIAGFILFRLYKVLGQDVGIKVDRTPEPEAAKPFDRKAAFKEQYNDDVASSLRDVKKIDPEFDEEEFISGATKAFEMILEAVSKGDKDTLKALLAPKLYKDFDKLIDAREKKGQVWEHSLLRIKNATIKGVEIKDSMVFITIQIVSDQILVTKDAKGKIIEGDPDQIEVLTDTVTFSRDATSHDPNWMLVKTTTND